MFSVGFVSNWNMRNLGNKHDFSSSWFSAWEYVHGVCVYEACVHIRCVCVHTRPLARAWGACVCPVCMCNIPLLLVARTSRSSTCVIPWQCPWSRSVPGFISTVLTSCVKSLCPPSMPRSTMRIWPSAFRAWRKCTRTWGTRACSVPAKLSSRATMCCSISTRETS